MFGYSTYVEHAVAVDLFLRLTDLRSAVVHDGQTFFFIIVNNGRVALGTIRVIYIYHTKLGRQVVFNKRLSA